MNITIRGVTPPFFNFVTPSAVKSLGSARPCKGVGLKGAGKKCVPFAALLALLLSTQLAQAQTPTPPTTVEEETAARIEADNALRDSITDTDISTTQGINAAGTRITNEIRDRTSADTALGARIDAIDGTAETTAREAADATLTTAVADETTARTDADTALGARIDGVATARTAAIATETTARTTADTALGARIDGEATARATETTARTDADTALGARIDGEATARATETTARTDADTALGARIDAIAIGAGAYDDTALAERVTTETTARTTADTALGARIDSEATARATETTARTDADTALGARIDGEATARTAAIATETMARTAADTAIRARIDAFTSTGAYDDTAINDRVDENAAAINGFGRRLDDLEAELSTGIALSLAMQAPTVSPGKTLNLSLGAGTYNGENAAAFSFGVRVNEYLSVNGGVGYGTSRSDFGARLGATVEF